MKYVVLTNRGFQMRGSETALYDTQEDALEKAAPGDQILPIQDNEELEQYKRGRKRLPTFNSNFRGHR